MASNIVKEYIDFSKKNITKYLKIILEQDYSKEIIEPLLDTYINVRYYNNYDIKYKAFESNINYYMKQKAIKINEEKEEEYIEMCKSNRVAGVVFCSGNIATEKFLNLDCPLITFERFIDGGTAGILCDNYQGGTLAANRLIEKGCRHILHIGGVNEVRMPADDRKIACEEVCAQNGVEFWDVDPGQCFYDDMNYYEVIQEALKKHPQTDGIFAGSDVIAAQAIQICHENGITVPDQMKIVGFDDVNVASLTIPGITTIRQPIKEMAEAIIKTLESASSGKMVAAKTVFPVTLVIRGSA